MPLFGVAGVWRRQWILAFFGITGTLLWAFQSINREPIYFSQTDIVFLAPLSRDNPNALTVSSSSLIATASIVQRDLDQGRPGPRTSLPSVTLYDQGLYSNTRIRVPDTGGQWQHNFARPVLDLQVTGRDRTDVALRAQAVENDVRRRLQELQDRAQVLPVNQITVQASPREPSVTPVSGSRGRAVAAALALGTVATGLACAVLDRWRSRLRERPNLGADHAIASSR